MTLRRVESNDLLRDYETRDLPVVHSRNAIILGDYIPARFNFCSPEFVATLPRMELNISHDLRFPLDTVTSTLVVYGGKGMGKTNLCAVICEELYKQGLRFALLDPLGVNWGLQYGRTKSTPGLKVLILGGIHGDVPIEPTGGAVVADLIVESDISVIIDISRRPDGQSWSMGERVRFVAEYCSRLYQRQGQKRRPIMQLIDEAGRFCPQTMPKGAEDIAKCMGAIEQMVEWGRNVGIGVSLITQRSARMNKSVSELADAMIAFRTVGPNSVEAITDWLGEHVEKDRIKEIVRDLRSMERGSAIVVSPGWLKAEKIVRVRMRETFDSSATPKPGVEPVAPGTATKLPDLEAFKIRMAETIERVKLDDPKELRSKIITLNNRIQILQRELNSKPEESEPDLKVHEELEDAIRDNQGLREDINNMVSGNSAQRAKIAEICHQLLAVNGNAPQPTSAVTHVSEIGEWPNRGPFGIASMKGAREFPLTKRSLQEISNATNRHTDIAREIIVQKQSGDSDIGNGGLRRILIALAQYPAGRSARQVGVLAGLSSKSGSFGTYLSKLRTLELISGSSSDLRASETLFER